ncbi:MAG: KOW domain-containing RNA-binding protein [Eubacterium sp.]|nr:KOW domain-containing RNA-binding protein [Eubacterium sp.]
MDDIKVGQVVRSLAGRDKGQFMVVLELLDQGCVAICDGGLRKISNPKKKKVKHLAKTNHIVTMIKEKLDNGERLNNAEIRKCLESFNVDDGKSEEV